MSSVLCQINTKADNVFFRHGKRYAIENNCNDGRVIIRDEKGIPWIVATEEPLPILWTKTTFTRQTEIKKMSPLKRLLALFTVSAAFMVTGCASVVSDTQWPVSINSNPDGAEFRVKNQHGAVVSGGVTPQTVMLPGGAGYFDGETYAIEFELAGYSSATVTLDSKLNGWYWGNLVFGGLPGLLLIDPLSGAMWRLPSQAYAELSPEQKLSDAR